MIHDMLEEQFEEEMLKLLKDFAEPADFVKNLRRKSGNYFNYTKCLKRVIELAKQAKESDAKKFSIDSPCDVCGRLDGLRITSYTKDGHACSPECCDKLPINEERAQKWEVLKKQLTIDINKINDS